MSVAQTLDIEAYRLLDERLSMNQDTRQFQVKIGGSNVNYRTEKSTSANSQNQITFNLTPNSCNNVLDRTILFKAKVVLEFTRTSVDGFAAGSRVLNDGKDALRGFNYIVQSTNLSINGQTITEETKYVHDIFNRFTDDLDSLVKFKSLTPSLMNGDLTSDYTKYAASSNFNSLGAWNDSSRRSLGRGFFPYDEIVNTAAVQDDHEQTASVTVFINELIHLSPCEYQGNQIPGLANVTSLQLTLNLDSDKNKIWSHAKVDAAESTFSVKATIIEPEIQFTEITLPIFYSLPPTISTGYYELVRQTSRSAEFTSGKVADLRSDTYQMNQVPSRIIIFARPKENYDATKPEFYGVIKKLNIQYNNMSSIINSASQEQLFMISSINGTNQSWAEFAGSVSVFDQTIEAGGSYVPTTGSIVCLEFGKDISSDATAIPGTSINANLQITATVGNQTGVTQDFELVILYVYAGVLVISPGASFKYTSILTRDETLSLPLLEGATVGSDHLKGGMTCPSAVHSGLKMGKDVLKSYKAKQGGMKAGMDAGMQARGVYESGSSSGLSGGRSVAKSSLRDRFA